MICSSNIFGPLEINKQYSRERGKESLCYWGIIALPVRGFLIFKMSSNVDTWKVQSGFFIFESGLYTIQGRKKKFNHHKGKAILFLWESLLIFFLFSRNKPFNTIKKARKPFDFPVARSRLFCFVFAVGKSLLWAMGT